LLTEITYDEIEALERKKYPEKQNELSTIIERELTSQRRSSNGGPGTQTICLEKNLPSSKDHNLKIDEEMEVFLKNPVKVEEVKNANFETEGQWKDMRIAWEAIQQKER